MECRDEVAAFLDGRECWVRDREVGLEEAVRMCCESIEVHASASRRRRTTPVIRFVVRDPAKNYLALDALAIVREWLDRLGALDVAYAVVSNSFAEVRFREECFEECDAEKASRIASATLRALESRFRKLCIASGGVLEVVNVVAVEGARAKLVAPRCGAKYFRLESVDRYLWVEEVEHEPSWIETKCVGAQEIERRASSARMLEKIAAPSRAVVPKTFGRFEVMALLQAARYYLLTGDLAKAKSFGLNRAIFYAWAKYYGPRGRAWMAAIRSASRGLGSAAKAPPLEDEVPVSPRGWFEMDGREQLPEDFDRQVGMKIEASIPFTVAWRRSVAYVKKFPREVLRDPNKFFKYVYEPVRDSFVDRVVANAVHGEVSTVVERAWREAREFRKSGVRTRTTRSLEEFFGERGLREDSSHH